MIMARKRLRVSSVFVSLMVVTVITPSVLPGERGPRNPGVIPPQARFRGLTYGEWAARWAQAANAIPVVDGDHPLFSGGTFGGEDGVVFVPGLTGGVTVEVTIPVGTALFFPLIVAGSSDLEPPPFFGADEAEQAAIANFFIDGVTDLGAVIDGRTVEDPEEYRTQSPQYAFSVPDSNILGLPSAATGTGVSAGFFLLLHPMSRGTHTIQFTATYAPFEYVIDTTYIINVVPR
jgi:hypothetical protein